MQQGSVEIEIMNIMSLFFRLCITMGIHGLAKLIADQAPGAIKEQDMKNYFGNCHTSLFQHINYGAYITNKKQSNQSLMISALSGEMEIQQRWKFTSLVYSYVRLQLS